MGDMGPFFLFMTWELPMLISTAFAQDGAAAAPGGGMLEMFLPLILIFSELLLQMLIQNCWKLL